MRTRRLLRYMIDRGAANGRAASRAAAGAAAAVIAATLAPAPPPAQAGEADVLAVEVRAAGPGLYDFAVTVRHADEGWDHYADRFEVVGPDDAVLGVRTLLHPHVDEQPFTRELRGVAIPAGVDSVRLRAHDSVDGYGGAEVAVELPQ